MYPTLQSCIMNDYQYPQNLNSSWYQENFNSYSHNYTQHCQPRYSSPANYQDTHGRHLGYLQDAVSQDTSLSTQSFQMDHNVIPCRIVNNTTTSSIYEKQSIQVKPPYSYAALICQAIGSRKEKKATMREILHYIECNFPYYRSNRKWHGTIRHDLTVNDCFVKLDPRPGQKACLWAVHPEFQDMFAKGNFRRRRYRFKKGSPSLLKARQQSAAKQDRSVKEEHFDISQIPAAFSNSTSPLHSLLEGTESSPSTVEYVCASEYNISSDSDRTTENDLISKMDSTIEVNHIYSTPESSKPLESYDRQGYESSINDLLTMIPDFEDCVDELYHSFQTDYYNVI